MRSPPAPAPFRLRLYLSSPWFVLPALALIASPQVYERLAHVEPTPVIQIPPLSNTPAALPFDLGRAMIGTLPKPADNQKKEGECVPGIEVVINGGCWMATDKTPPCPEPKGGWVFYAHEGKCYVPVGHTARPATSGGAQQAGVAGQ